MISKFDELFEKQHRGTQNLTHTPDFATLRYVAKIRENKDVHSRGFFGRNRAQIDIITLKTCKTDHN